MKKQKIDPNDLIDFPCSATWISYYAEQGMTRDFPPEFYEKTELNERITELENRIKQLEGNKATIRYLVPNRPLAKPIKKDDKPKIDFKGGAEVQNAPDSNPPTDS